MHSLQVSNQFGMLTKFASFPNGDITVHFSAHNSDLTLYITADIRILAYCQNTVDRGNLTVQVPIKNQRVPKLERTSEVYVFERLF